MRRPRIIVVGALLLIGMLSAGAQDITREQEKLRAKRGAEADAFRKLAEIVYGFHINSQTQVRDFVAESDEINTDVDAFIKGIRLGQPSWYDDGSCEIPAEVTVAKVIETLRTAHNRHYRGDSIKTEDFESMTQRIEKKVIKVIGMGAPRDELPPGLPEGTLEIIGAAPAAPPATRHVPDVWAQIPARARLMAIRSARVEAMRKLAERLKGLRLTSRTQVRDFVAESDDISAAMDTLMSTSGEEVSTYLHHDELIVEVTLRVPTEQVITTIKKLHSRHYKGDDIKGHDLEQVVKTVVKKDFEETGMGVPPPKYLERYVQTTGTMLPDWSMGPISATGSGTDPAIDTPQGRLRAARAAELDAKRKLAERINGFQIRSQTLVRDFIAEHDEVATLVEAYIMGAIPRAPEFLGDTVNVTVTMQGMQVWEVIDQQQRREARQ